MECRLFLLVTVSAQMNFLKVVKTFVRQTEKQLTATSAECFVDIFKACTFGRKSDVPILRFLVPDMQNPLQVRDFFLFLPPPLLFLNMISSGSTVLKSMVILMGGGSVGHFIG